MNKIVSIVLICFIFACSKNPSGSHPKEGDSVALQTPSLIQVSHHENVQPAVVDSKPSSTKELLSSKPWNVIVVSIDSLRFDMPWSGYNRKLAPTLTEFSKLSFTYSRFYSISSYTSMSLGGFLTGHYPSEVERSGYFFGSYPESVLMFPEILQKVGIRTLSAQAHFYFSPTAAGFHQGFDVYELVPNIEKNNLTDVSITSQAHVALAKKQLGNKENDSKRFFAWFHFMDPHDQYLPHPGIPSFGKTRRDKYDGEVEFVDQQLGDLFTFIKNQTWYNRTIIIITSDHGESFGEHQMFGHGFELWDVITHVPLMIYIPGIKPKSIPALRGGIDLAPTILEIFGLKKEPSMKGSSLIEDFGETEVLDRDVYIDLPRTSDNDRRRALIHGNYKLISFGDDDAFRLYNLSLDPGETKDIQKAEPEKFQKMMELYKNSNIHDVCPKQNHKLKGKKKSKKC